jgi:hypothetical protein
MIGMHGQAIEVKPPAVPSAHQGPDDPFVVAGEQQGLRVALDQAVEGDIAVRGAVRILGCHLPEREHGGNVGGEPGAQDQFGHGVTLADRLRGVRGISRRAC